jgi:hypothetical protein
MGIERWKKTCPRCKQKAPCLSRGDFKACPNCYVEEFGEWQTDDICSHGNDANHVPCEKCWGGMARAEFGGNAPTKRKRPAKATETKEK